MEVLKGSSLVGKSSTRVRVENDYYATPFESVRKLLDVHKLDTSTYILEPACGQGHIIKVLNERYDTPIVGTDIVDREKICDTTYPNEFHKVNFLEQREETIKKPSTIITNPPFKLIQEFIEKSLDVVTDGGQVIMFAKIQLLEGKKRKELFKKYPPKYIYVFSERQTPLPNGSNLNENGKKWSSTMCFAWFIWEKDSKTEPIVRWI